MHEPELEDGVRDGTRIRRLHVPPVVVRGQLDRRIKCTLEVAFGRVHLKQAEEGAGAELGLEAALERVLRLVLVVQPEREFAQDLPLRLARCCWG